MGKYLASTSLKLMAKLMPETGCANIKVTRIYILNEETSYAIVNICGYARLSFKTGNVSSDIYQVTEK